MSAIADLVTFLNSNGISAEFHGKIIDIAMQHGIEQMDILRKSMGIPRNSAETSYERRLRKDRDRKRNSAETKKGGSLTSFSEEILKEEETSKKEESKKERAREAELSESFGLFWGRWPNKVGKPAALKALRSALKRACHAEIMAGVENYIRDKPPDRHWLNPATFLNQNRWEDQPATASISKPLTEFQRKQAETNDIRSQLRNFANGVGGGGKADRYLSDDHSSRPEDVRGGSSANLLALPRAFGR